MLKAGLLPAPVIQPLRFDTIGTRIKVGPNTYIQIKSDVPGAKIYFTTDGTKPGPFQVGRTGKSSTHKYIGPFRLQLGNRVVKAIVSSRDRLRESQIATRYIDVLPGKVDNSNSDHESSLSDEEPNEFMNKYQKRPSFDLGEVQGSVEGPINPINYSGTQINVWGFPTPELVNYLTPKPPPTQTGFLTENMIKNLNTPRPIEYKPAPNEFDDIGETLKKFFKQILKLYERDTDFQNSIDYLIENGQLKWAEIEENNNAFKITMNCPKFLIDEPIKKPVVINKPKPKPRPVSPPIEILDNKRAPSPPPAPPSPPPPPPAPKPKPAPVKIEEIKIPKEPEPLQIYIEENQQQGTLVDAPNFNAEKDSESLRNAMKGFGTKEDVLINICGNRSNTQRLQIKDIFKAMFGKDLVEELKSETSGNFKKLLVGLFMSHVEYDCMEIRKAIQGLGTDDSTLIEILTSRSNKRLKEVSQLYLELYKKKLEDEISGDTSGAYRKLLVSILSCGRPETNEVDMSLVRQDVDELIKAGVKKLGTDEAKFNTIFGVRSYAHLRQMFDEYQKVAKKSIEDAIKSEMSGNLCKTYLSLINNIRNKPAYFAKEIKKSIKGLGTDEHTLNRIILSRCEVDMIQIKNEYRSLFNIDMEKDIKGDVSGDYGKLLSMLIKDPSERTFEELSQPEEPHIIEQVEEEPIEETPTLVEYSNFNPQNDSERLRKAMKGLGTDEKTIIEIIGKRSRSQRQELKNVFKSMFGRDLVQDLHSELSGSFRDTIEGLMMSSDEFDAVSFRKSVSGLGTDESALVELLTTRSPEEINAAKNKYQKMYNRNLEADIKSDTSGNFKNVLVSLLTASRPSGNTVDRTQARLDSQGLVNAGIKKLGTDESKFVTILCTRSFSQLRAMFTEYENLTGHTIEEDLKKEFSGDLLKIFSSIVACVRDKQAHFATILYKAMKGLGTKENSLIRVICSRCEKDMVQIKQKFQELYKKNLADYLKGDVSGDFAKILLILIGDEDAIKK